MVPSILPRAITPASGSVEFFLLGLLLPAASVSPATPAEPGRVETTGRAPGAERFVRRLERMVARGLRPGKPRRKPKPPRNEMVCQEL